MPRKPLILTDSAPYHITNRSNNQEFFYLPNELLWPIFMDTLNEVEKQFEVRLHAFLLMTNHYHMLVSTPRLNIGASTRYLQTEVARKANGLTKRKNHFFGGRYKWSVISDENNYWNSVKYIFRNPVRAGICDAVEKYRFSSLNFKSNLFDWKMTDFFLDPTKPIELDLEWLNEPFLIEQEQAIGRALRRREFQLSKDKKGQVASLPQVQLNKKLR